MIDIAQLRKEDVGKWVLYEPNSGRKEKGRIKSWNDNWIFVVYNCAGEWDRYRNFTGNATDPKQLRFTTKSEMV